MPPSWIQALLMAHMAGAWQHVPSRARETYGALIKRLRAQGDEMVSRINGKKLQGGVSNKGRGMESWNLIEINQHIYGCFEATITHLAFV